LDSRLKKPAEQCCDDPDSRYGHLGDEFKHVIFSFGLGR
jgi:hypothetical protein